ncbi:DUF3857 domain-containing protein [Marinifilum sp. N1E240]|uniref:DUF3857 domain-containing protein n=1 Tax=Marinifilum sp. N1E240 TaxID=2608082 RepID=UPI00128BB263|nr:DUF3857 domain-containing protein [Marinifilum sp. N1E240]MPQ48817.1 DUF3857 domain-containing protein [Marinifilum sp. N1E240]
MNRVLITLLLFLFCSLNPQLSNCENIKLKFGKVSIEELEMKNYQLDTNAVAVILYDNGYSFFDYENNETNSGFVCKFERHVRIKILKEEGFNYANFEIPIYHDKNGYEGIYAIKGKTFNLESKIISSKLEKNQIFYEESTPNWKTVKFTMPNIKVGSVIDCKYVIKSPFYHNFKTWQFQYSIPVIYSKYRTQIPEYFKYQKTIKGYYPIHEEDLGNKVENIMVEYKEMNTKYGNIKMERHRFTLNPTSSIYEYSGENIPAFQSESYMLANKNYLSRIEFELQSYQIGISPLHRYSSTWNTVREKLIKSESFGVQIKKLAFTKNVLANIVNPTDSELDKIGKIYQTIQNEIKWNGLNRLYTSKSLKDIWKDKKGNSAEVNLLLVALLRGAGIDAYPVVLSTRNNGIIHPSHPTITQMNYVIASAEIEGKQLLMDATDPYCPIGILPFRCLNEKGRLISESRSEWVDLNPTKGSKINLMANLKLTKEGDLTGNFKEVFYDYEAIKQRKNFNIKTEEAISKLIDENDEWNIENVKLTNLNDRYKPLVLTYSTLIENHANIEGDKIYLNPILKYHTTKNPFKLEKREYPVNFGHPMHISYLLILEIPKGYTTEYTPKPSMITLPENGGTYSYKAVLSGNKIMASLKFNINNSHFVPDEYEILKEFYNQIITKEGQILILKKDETTAIK